MKLPVFLLGCMAGVSVYGQEPELPGPEKPSVTNEDLRAAVQYSSAFIAQKLNVVLEKLRELSQTSEPEANPEVVQTVCAFDAQQMAYGLLGMAPAQTSPERSAKLDELRYYAQAIIASYVPEVLPIALKKTCAPEVVQKLQSGLQEHGHVIAEEITAAWLSIQEETELIASLSTEQVQQVVQECIKELHAHTRREVEQKVSNFDMAQRVLFMNPAFHPQQQAKEWYEQARARMTTFSWGRSCAGPICVGTGVEPFKLQRANKAINTADTLDMVQEEIALIQQAYVDHLLSIKEGDPNTDSHEFEREKSKYTVQEARQLAEPAVKAYVRYIRAPGFEAPAWNTSPA